MLVRLQLALTGGDEIRVGGLGAGGELDAPARARRARVGNVAGDLYLLGFRRVKERVPARLLDPGLGRDVVLRDRLHRLVDVGSAIAVLEVEAGFRRPGDRGGHRRRHVGGGGAQHLDCLVGCQRRGDPVLSRRLLSIGENQCKHATDGGRRLGGRSTGGRGGEEVMRAPGRVAGARPVGGRRVVLDRRGPGDEIHAVCVGDHPVAGQHVLVEHAALVVGRVEVVGGLDHRGAMPPDVVDRLAHEGRVAEVGGRGDQHVGVHVRRVHPGLREVVCSVQGLGAGLDRQQATVRADTGSGESVVGLRRGLLHLAVRVVVGGVKRGRVVLVVVKVPAGDVVDVAVVVVVDAV